MPHTSRALTVTVGFLLSLASSGVAFERVAPVHAKRLELLQFVLRRDAAWSVVLNQQVKLAADDRPPYRSDASLDAGVQERLQLMDDDAVMVAPLAIIQTVMSRFAWLGSYVEYAVRLLQQALTCVVYVHVSHVMEILQALEVKTVEMLKTKTLVDARKKDTRKMEDAPSEEEESSRALEEELEDRFSRNVEPFQMSYREVWSTLTMLADQLALVGGQLEIMADLSNMLSEAKVKGRVIPFTVIELMRRNMDRMIDGRCDRPKPVRVYIELGYISVHGNPFSKASTPKGLEMSISSISRKLFAFYNTLYTETVAMKTWALVFNYKIANMKNVSLPSTIDRMLEEDSLKRLIEQKRSEYNTALLYKYVRKKLEREIKKEKSDKQKEKISIEI